MAIVSPGNAAFTSAMREARRALRIGTMYGIMLVPEGEKYRLNLIDARRDDQRYLGTVCSAIVDSVDDIVLKMTELADFVDLDEVPIFMVRPNDGQFRYKLVLVNPRTLNPQETPRGFIESVYNTI